MGMAASQSRFLSLTARKSNTEFQGQQVNQQRTVLSNQSANLYNQLMTMDVPTPPSVDSYYNKTYSFVNQTSNGNVTYSFDSYSTVNKKMTVSYTESANIMKSAGFATYKNGEGFKIGKSTINLSDMQAVSADDKGMVAAKNTSNIDNWKNSADNSRVYQINYLNDKNENEVCYIPANIYDSLVSVQNSTDSASSLEFQYWKAEEGTIKRQAEISDVEFKFNTSGRVTGVTLKSQDEKTGLPAGTYMTDFSKVKDDEAYEQAMIDYKYKLSQYEQEYERINAETEKIQAKDKNLELKLKQLDTEQQAIQTEMEAVTKVIDKNIEDTFKTFA